MITRAHDNRATYNTVRWNIGPLHSKGDTVQSDEEQHCVVKPPLGHQVVADPPQAVVGVEEVQGVLVACLEAAVRLGTPGTCTVLQ